MRSHVPKLTKMQMYTEKIKSLKIDRHNLNSKIVVNNKQIENVVDVKVVSASGVAISLLFVDSWVPVLMCISSLVIAESIENKIVKDNIKNMYDQHIIDIRITAAKESLAIEKSSENED
jgi:hypothetical protein